MAELSINDLPVEAENIEQPDYDNYVDPSEAPPALPDGSYTFKTTAVRIKKFDEKTKIVTFELDHQAFDDQGQEVGQLRFDTVSTKVFERNNIRVSQAADQLRAWGDSQRPRSPAEWGTAFKSHEGEVWKGVAKLEAGCNHADTPQEVEWGDQKVVRFKGEKQFHKNDSGQYEATCPTCQQQVTARAKVSRRIPKS